MDVWPAIDLRGGKCVRLRQGDYAQETVFGDDPAAMARHWVELGAKRLHLVDLDGARDGCPVNYGSVRAITDAVGVPCELGGGIRSEEAIRTLFDLGLERLVIGTLALREPDWFRQVCRKYPGRMVLGIDARGGRVATEGWLATSDVTAVELPRRLCRRADCGHSIYRYCDGRHDGRAECRGDGGDAGSRRVARGGLGRRNDTRGRRSTGRGTDGRLHHRPGPV